MSATSNRRSRSKSPKNNAREYLRSTSNPVNIGSSAHDGFVNNSRDKPRRSISAQQADIYVPEDINQTPNEIQPFDQDLDDMQALNESEVFVTRAAEVDPLDCEEALLRLIEAHQNCRYRVIFGFFM